MTDSDDILWLLEGWKIVVAMFADDWQACGHALLYNTRRTVPRELLLKSMDSRVIVAKEVNECLQKMEMIQTMYQATSSSTLQERQETLSGLTLQLRDLSERLSSMVLAVTSCYAAAKSLSSSLSFDPWQSFVLFRRSGSPRVTFSSPFKDYWSKIQSDDSLA
jgi:hypothetical protein